MFDSFLFSKPLVLSCVINIIFVIMSYAKYSPFNETNDDTGMAALIAGAYGGGETHLVFTNVIYSLFLKIFYMIIPSVNWYSFFQFVIVFISFTVIGYVLIERIGRNIGIIIYIFLLAAFRTEFYLLYQFTRVSTICGIAGYLLIFHSIEKEKYIKGTISGCALVLLGFLVRYSSSMSVLPFAGVLGIVYTLGNKKYWPLHKNIKKLSRYFATFGILFSMIIAVVALDKAYYYSDPEWKEYYDYNKLRADILDYGWPQPWPTYEEYSDDYAQIGVSENDVLLYSSGVLSDVENLTLERLEEFKEFKESHNTFKFDLKEFLYYSYRYFINNGYIWIILLAILLYLLLFKYKTRFTILIILDCLIFMAIFGYYYYQNRIVPRAFVSTVFVTVCVILFCYSNENLLMRKINLKQAALLGLTTIFFSIAYVSPHYLELSNSRLDVTKLYDILANDKNSIFVAGRDVFRWNYRYFDAYKVIPENFYSNQINIGGWLSRTPTMNNHMKELGVDNLYTDLVEKDNMYFYTDSFADILCTYLNEHYYGGDVSYSIISKADWVKFVKYSVNFDNINADIAGKCDISNVYYDPDYEGYVDIEISNIEATENKDIYLEITDPESGIKYTYKGTEPWENENNQYNCTVIIPQKDFSNISNCEMRVIICDSNSANYVETNNMIMGLEF